MAQVVAGDRAAFTQLVTAHRGRVRRVALALVGDAATADDVLQETFLAALRSAHTYRGPSLRAWLSTIARHQAARHYRRARPVATEDETLMQLGAAAGFGNAAYGAIAERDAVRVALATLADDDREILVLRDVEGLSGDETAEVLGLPLAAMKSRLHRARLRLAAALTSPGGAA